jgi:hypothetical protein
MKILEGAFVDGDTVQVDVSKGGEIAFSKKKK